MIDKQHCKVRYEQGFWEELDPFYDFSSADRDFVAKIDADEEMEDAAQTRDVDDDHPMARDQLLRRRCVTARRRRTYFHVREGVHFTNIFYGGLGRAFTNGFSISKEVVAQRRRVDLPVVGNRRREAGQHEVLAQLDVRGPEPEEEDAARLDAALRVGAPQPDLAVVDLVRFFLRGGEGRHARGG